MATQRRLIDRISLELSADVAMEVRRLSDRTGDSIRKIIEESIVEHIKRIKAEGRATEPESERTAEGGSDTHAS